MRLLALLLCCLATACQREGTIKPDLPTAPIVTSKVVYVDRYIYVSVPDRLTEEQPIAEGPLSEAPNVAASRKASLKKTNAQLREIRAIQGTAVKK